MHLISTDLPEPEPPMTTSDCPFSTARSMPSSTTLEPKDLRTPLSSIFAVMASLGEEHGSEDVVRQQDQDRGRDHRVGGRLADALRAAPRVEAVIAAHQRDQEA